MRATQRWIITESGQRLKLATHMGDEGGVYVLPGAGHDGGQVVFEGRPADLVAPKSTLTGKHLTAFLGR